MKNQITKSSKALTTRWEECRKKEKNDTSSQLKMMNRDKGLKKKKGGNKICCQVYVFWAQ